MARGSRRAPAVLSAVLLLCMAAAAAAAAYSATDPLAAHTDEAIKHDRAGDMDAALGAFRTAVKLEEGRPLGERLANLGVCLMRMRRFDESIENMVKAARMSPTSDDATKEHIQSNWKNLMAHLDFHEIPRPVWPEPRGVGGAVGLGQGEDDDGWFDSAEEEEEKAEQQADKIAGIDEDGWSDDDYAESGVEAPVDPPPPPPPPSKAAAAAEKEVTEIYKEHNPSKLKDVPGLIAKYAGKEGKLLRKLKKKYKIFDHLRPRQLFKLEIPRVTAAELAANETLMSGHWPYVLTGEVDKWPAAKKWGDLNYLLNKIPSEWVDFYPRNMYQLGSKPYVQPYSEALPRFRQNTGESKYMQMRLSLAGWYLHKQHSPQRDYRGHLSQRLLCLQGGAAPRHGAAAAGVLDRG